MGTPRGWVSVLVLAVVSAGAVAAFAAAPNNIDDVVERVRRMRERGESNQVIAQYITETVDARITNGNSLEGDVARYSGYYSGDDTIFNRWSEFETNREQLDEQRGREFIARARWAWDNEYGHCAENASIVYYILHGAGIPARLLNVPGHAFTVMDMPESADVTDASTWGDAYVIDPWYGMSAAADDLEGLWNRWGAPQDSTREDQTNAYHNEARYAQYHPDEMVDAGTDDVEYVVWKTGNVDCWDAPLIYVSTRERFEETCRRSQFSGGGCPEDSEMATKDEMMGGFASQAEAESWLCPMFTGQRYHRWCGTLYYVSGGYVQVGGGGLTGCASGETSCAGTVPSCSLSSLPEGPAFE